MRNFLLSALMLIVALTFFERPAQAQQTDPNAQGSKTDNSELREKAFATLESLAGQLNTLQSAENRARIGANIAESLWKRDETRARALFLLVQEEIKSRLTRPEGEDPKERQTFLVFLKLRSDTVERIAKFDAELAFSFFKATEIDLSKLPAFLVDDQQNLDLRLSQKVAAHNPEVALRLARLALERGFSEELLEVLGRVNRKHKEHAQVLYKEIIEKLRHTDIEKDWPAKQFVYILVRNFQPPAFDELAFRDLIGFLITTAAANGCDRKPMEDDTFEFCHWAASALANVEKIDPRAGRLKRWMPERGEDGEYEASVRARQALVEVAEEGSVDDLLALAGKYPELAEEIHWRAMQKARSAGDLKLMRKVAEEYRGNPVRRQELIEELARFEQAAVVDDEQMAKLQVQLNETPGLQDRLMLLISSAYRAGGSDRKTALKLLNQAERLVATMSPGKERTVDEIGLALVYCLEKDDRGFTIMESLVPRLNSLVDAAVKLDGYDTSYLRDGEWDMSANGSVGELLTRLSEGAEFFAWSDFDRAMSLAAQFDRAEIRMMAQLKLAQSILAGPHKRVLFQ